MQDPGGNMNSRNTPKWSPMKISNPSTKLRQARSMPQWVTRDTTPSSVVPPPPPPPEVVTPPVDPDYEVIEFPSQQYSNTEPIIEKVRKSKTPGRCDLCGSSIPTVKCEHCPSQHFCASCDDMYHRHPKRQHHSRKVLGPPLRPPLPPKGEPISAPVPPPRRNKHSSARSSSSRFTPSPLSHQFQLSSSTHTLKKEPSGLIGSLKRFMGGRPLPPPPHMLSRDSRMSQPTLQLKNIDYHRDNNKPSSIDSGYLDWDSDRRTRSGSFSAINHPTMPAFGVMGQAQSMAQLNCPSCLHHPSEMPNMGWNNWNNPLNLQHPQSPSGWSTLGHQPHQMWHGSQILPPGQFPHREDFSRRGSLRHSARRSRRDSSSERSDFRQRDDVRSRHADSSSEEDIKRGGKHSRHGGRVSPATSYRSRHPLSDIDSEGDTMSRKGGRRRRRKSPVPASPATSRKSRRHSPVKNRRKAPSRVNSSDTDSDLSSEVEVKRTGVERGVRQKLTRSWSKSSKADAPIDNGPMPWVPATERTSVPFTEKTSLPITRTSGWECAHCTLVNPAGTTVCSVCCKTSNASLAAKSEEILNEDFVKLKMEDKAEQSEQSNGKQESGLKKGRAQSVDFLGTSEVISTGTSPPPQSISTQTYDYGGRGNPGLKRATSLADDVWRPIIRPVSRQSTLDSHSMVNSPIPTPDVIAQNRAAYEFNKFTRSQSQLSQHLPFATEPHQIIRPNFKRAGSQPPEYFTTVAQNQVKQGLEMVKLLKEAEQNGFTAEDLTIALSHCGDSNPVTWLINNWRHMMDTVVTLASNYGHEKGENNNIGTLSVVEARDALRLHNGNVWAAVTECVETRQKKFNDLMSRGNFSREDIVTVLTANHGNVESAYVELNKTQLKPFLMRIWGPPQGLDNDCGDVSRLWLEEGDILMKNGEVKSPEVSYVRDWLFDDKVRKENRSMSMSEINHERLYDDFGDDKAVIRNMQLRYDKERDSQVRHRISTIYSSNVDLRINTEPKQYSEGVKEKRRDDSIEYIDDDDAESLTIRNTLHNEYVAAILTNVTQYTDGNVNKKQIVNLEFENQTNDENRNKIRTAFVPYYKLKESGDSLDSNVSTVSLRDNSVENTNLKTLETKQPINTLKHNSPLDKESRKSRVESKPNNCNPSQELKYTNSFSGKHCKKPNVAKRKLTKSIKSVKKKVKSKLLGQKANDEHNTDSLDHVTSKSTPSQQAVIAPKQEIISKPNLSDDGKKSEKNPAQTQKVEQVMKELEVVSSNDSKTSKGNTSMKNEALPPAGKKQIKLSEDTCKDINTNNTKSLDSATKVQTQKNCQQSVKNQQQNTSTVNIRDKGNMDREKKIIVNETPIKNKDLPSVKSGSSVTTSSTVLDKTVSIHNEIAPTTKHITPGVIEKNSVVVDEISTPLNQNNEKETVQKPFNEENEIPFQTRKASAKSKNKRNKWNKKNQNIEKRKIEPNLKEQNTDEGDNGKNAVQQTRVTEINITENKPQEKVTVEFEKDIVFVSDGETHKLIINPQIEKIELLKKKNSPKDDNTSAPVEKIQGIKSKTKSEEQDNGKNHETIISVTKTIPVDSIKSKKNINEMDSQSVPLEKNKPPTQNEKPDSQIKYQQIHFQIKEHSGKTNTEVSGGKSVVIVNTTTKQPIQENKSLELLHGESSSESDEEEWEDEETEEDENNKENENKVKQEEKILVPKQEEQLRKITVKEEIQRLEPRTEDFEEKGEQEEEVEEEEVDEEEEIEESTEDDTTESSNVITKQYIKPTSKTPVEAHTESDTNTDDPYVDAKDNSSSSGKVESSTDENSDFLSVQSEFSQLENFLNDMSAQPRSSNNQSVKSESKKNIDKIKPKLDPLIHEENEKKKAVQILTSKIAQIQKQESLIADNRISPTIDSKQIEVKTSSPTDLFKQSTLEIQLESPTASNSEKELVVVNTERAGTSSSADVSSEILDSSSRFDPRDLHTSPTASQQTQNKQTVKEETKMTMTENRQEILELLKQSLSNETVLEDIVNKLFSSVMGGDTGVFNKDANILNAQINTTIAHSTNSNIVGEGKTEPHEKQSVPQQSSVKQNQSSPDNGIRSLTNFPLYQEPTATMRALLNPPPQSLSISPTESYGSDFEREVRRCLAEGLVTSYDQAELAVKLMRLSFDRELSLAAARDCSTEQAALAYLQQECTLCAGKYPMGKMVSMLECEHHCCRDCAIAYFTLTITERSIQDCVCPFCQLPDLAQYDSDRAMNYFGNLDILLKSFVDEATHELFQRKLRDRTLMQDPNFKWCTKCSSGFIADPRHRKFICPDCNSVTCAKCNRSWAKEHERKSCDEYSAWLELADPHSTISKHLIENDGIVCPQCNAKYALAKGGCMHLTCPSCKFEFCSDCGRQFLMGAKCTVSPFCEKLGLHSHHPRNCLFYLRDKEPKELQKLLKEAGVEFKADESTSNSKCSVQLQREINGELHDSLCNLPVESATLCRTHYIEYLAKLIHQYKLDPVVIFELNELLQELRRRGKSLPDRSKVATDQLYRYTCIKIIQEEIPLE